MAEQITWTSAGGGSVIDLTDEAAGYTVAANGTGGLRSVAYALTSTQYAGMDGMTVSAVRALPNEPLLGIIVSATTEADLRGKIRGLVRSMRPKAGPGTLTVANETGGSRSLTCYCMDGLPGSESADNILEGGWWKAALKFYAPSPWWLGEERTMSAGLGAPTAFFPFFPMVLSSSQVQGQFTVDLSDSDDPAYPVWTITGPGSGLVLTNVTTNRSLTISASLASGEVMVVDTRPDFLSIRRGDGTNLLPAVAGYPDLWPLIEDINVVTAALSGATSNSRIVGSYQPRYAGI